MKRKDFLALAAAMIAAKRLERVEGRLTRECLLKDKGGEEWEANVATKEVCDIANDASGAALALASGLWQMWSEIRPSYEGLKHTEDEPFFDDEDGEPEGPIEKIADELHLLNDTMCNGDESIGGSLLRIANHI